MAEEKNKIQLFENNQVRMVWDEENEKWWLSIVDVVKILTDSKNPTDYLKKLRKRDTLLGDYIGTNCPQIEMLTTTGKKRKTLAGDTEQILRLIQSIPSKKAEPFKLWLAQVGSERIDETVDPELSINRAVENYRRLGYSESWINQRLRSIEVRKALTDEWDQSGVKRGKEYATLTDLMMQTWSGLNTREYKNLKGLKKENLRDNMTNTELVLNMLAEVSTTDISRENLPEGFDESKTVAKQGANIAKNAREQLEKQLGHSPVSPQNAKNLGQREVKKIEKDED